MSFVTRQLGDLTQLITKGTTPTTIGGKFAESGIPFVRAQNIKNGTISFENDALYIDAISHKLQKRSVIKAGDVLIAIAGTIGRVGVVPDHFSELNCNQAVAIIRVKNELNNQFLMHWLNSAEAITQIKSSTVVGVISNLSLSQISNLKINLPPLAEQKRIAEILDKAAEIKAKREQAIAKLDELERRAFDNLIETADEFLALNHVANFQSGGTPSKDNKEYWNGDIAWISSADIVNDQIIYGRNFITQKGLTESATSLAVEGQILVVTRTGVGKVAIADRDTCYSQDIVSLNLKDGYETNFIAAAIRANKANFIKQARGATIQGITKDVLGAAKVPKVTTIKQQEFSRLLNAINLQRTNLVNWEYKLSKLFASLQHQAFTTGFNA